jgi:hypothetical protein
MISIVTLPDGPMVQNRSNIAAAHGGEWVNTPFGTRGSQVQILPLRPDNPLPHQTVLIFAELRSLRSDSYGDRLRPR